MKLGKKECRKYADFVWKPDSENGLLHAEQIKYVVRSAVHIIAHQRVLILYIYPRTKILEGKIKPLWIVFQNRTDYLTLEHKEDGPARWRTAALENLERDYYFINQCAFYTAADEDQVTRFCNIPYRSGFHSLENLQSGIQYQRRKEAQERRDRLIVSRMKPVKGLPRDLKSWIHREAMPAYIFYDYKKGKKTMQGYCTACRREVQILGAKHNKSGMCPCCKRPVTYKSRGRRGYIRDRATMQVFDRLSDSELVVRFVKVYRNYNRQDIPEENIYENARIFLKWEGSDVQEEHYYYDWHGALTPWKKGDRPVFSQWQYNFEADGTGFLYHKNLDETLNDTPWQYSQLKTYYLAEPKPLYAIQYLERYLRYPMLEYLVKLGLYRLATEVAYDNSFYYGSDSTLNLKGRNLREVLGVDKSMLPLLQRLNPGTAQMKLIGQLTFFHIPLDEKLLTWCRENQISRTENITVSLQYMTPYKLMSYADEQFEKLKRKSSQVSGGYWKKEDLLSDYRDYLCMSEALEFDLKNSFVLFPANLKKAHDKVNDLSDKEQAKAYEKQIQKQFTLLQERYRFEKWGYMVVPPRSVKEILEEGHVLHHCVGSYVKSIVKRECTILFVRSRKEPEKPLCTLEVRGARLEQARVFDNDPPSPSINRFLEVWKQEVLAAPVPAEIAA